MLCHRTGENTHRREHAGHHEVGQKAQQRNSLFVIQWFSMSRSRSQLASANVPNAQYNLWRPNLFNGVMRAGWVGINAKLFQTNVHRPYVGDNLANILPHRLQFTF